MDNGEQKEIFSFQVQRTISALSKNFLNILEDLAEEYDRRLDFKGTDFGEKNYPPEDFLNDNHFSHLRKRILDRGGDAARELSQEIEKYKINLLTNEELQNEARKKAE